MDVLLVPYTGFPSPAGDWVEPSLNLHDLVILHPATTFFVRVKGDAMAGAGIHDGDLIVVDRAPAPADQQVILAILVTPAPSGAWSCCLAPSSYTLPTPPICPWT